MIEEEYLDEISDLSGKKESTRTLTINDVTKEDIIEAIQCCLQISPLITPSKTLINSVYLIMSSLFIENKKYVILEAPTGSGKTIIGFMSFFVVQYLYNKKNNYISNKILPIESLSYFLTSAKMLQEQIDSDLDRFDFRDYIFMLKGVANYDCNLETDRLIKPYKLDFNNKEITRISYADRPCKGLSKKDRSENPEYKICDLSCNYQLARLEASTKPNTVLNYAYFLNIMRSDFSPFFSDRLITFADEAHLIPDIVCNIFNFEFNQFLINQIFKLLEEIEIGYGSKCCITLKEKLMKCFEYFKKPLKSPSELKQYFNLIIDIRPELSFFIKEKGFETIITSVNKNIERIDELLLTYNDFKDLIETRPQDIFFESVQIAHDKTTDAKVYKHIVKDLSESEMVRKHFLTKLNKGVFMSATLGNIDEYANMMGMEKDEYVSLRLPSQFNFEKSPIFICKSSWLNYANFDKNIDKALMDTLSICLNIHPKEKGIIHTSTFKISNLLKEKINMGLVPDKNRFLFYQSAEEKEKMVNLMKESSKPYVIVGPSMYEGLDLKDDSGRFNILIKVPYSGIDDYTKMKMNRFPFWYMRNTLEKIIQAIGRTNRHINDYSSTYLIDSCFEKIIYETNESIIGRLKHKQI